MRVSVSFIGLFSRVTIVQLNVAMCARSNENDTWQRSASACTARCRPRIQHVGDSSVLVFRGRLTPPHRSSRPLPISINKQTQLSEPTYCFSFIAYPLDSRLHHHSIIIVAVFLLNHDNQLVENSGRQCSS